MRVGRAFVVNAAAVCASVQDQGQVGRPPPCKGYIQAAMGVGAGLLLMICIHCLPVMIACCCVVVGSTAVTPSAQQVLGRFLTVALLRNH